MGSWLALNDLRTGVPNWALRMPAVALGALARQATLCAVLSHFLVFFLFLLCSCKRVLALRH